MRWERTQQLGEGSLQIGQRLEEDIAIILTAFLLGSQPYGSWRQDLAAAHAYAHTRGCQGVRT